MHASQFAGAGTTQKQRLGAVLSMQDHYNLIYREEEREMLPLCWREGVAVIPWSPAGARTLNFRHGEKPARRVSDDVGKIYTLKAIK